MTELERNLSNMLDTHSQCPHCHIYVPYVQQGESYNFTCKYGSEGFISVVLCPNCGHIEIG